MKVESIVLKNNVYLIKNTFERFKKKEVNLIHGKKNNNFKTVCAKNVRTKSKKSIPSTF